MLRLDYTKTMLQTEEGGARFKTGAEALVWTVENSGPLGLYRGVGTQVAGVAPEKALKLYVNAQAKAALTVACGDGALPLAGECAAGLIAGVSQVIVTNPLEAVKIRLQTSQEGSPLAIIRELGVRGLYRGAGSCMLRDGCFSLVLFPCYDHAKELTGAATSSAAGAAAAAATTTAAGAPGSIELALALGLAGLLAAAPAAALSTPFDVVKTRVQAAKPAPAAADPGEDARRHLGSPAASLHEELPPLEPPLAAAAAIIREEGPAALFSGWLERVLRSAPQFAVTLSVADLLKQAAHTKGWL